jgi:citrate lyase subunit beta/citryl-CoA lyase
VRSARRAAAARVQAIDTIAADFRNLELLRRETEEGDGFTGKMAIHPAQVPVINEVFTPTADATAIPAP